MEENKFFIIGHGSEDVESERQVLPEGVTLVLSTVCGRMQSESNFIKYAKLFQAPFSGNPEDLPPEIQETFRIYKPGMEYPSISVTSLADFKYTNAKGKTKIGLYKSGVYKLPLQFNFDDTYMEKSITSMFGFDYIDNTDGILDKVYEGAVIAPDIMESIEKYGYEKTEIPLALMRDAIPVSKIFERLGPGIYYYLGCRTSEIKNYMPEIQKHYNKERKNILNEIPQGNLNEVRQKKLGDSFNSMILAKKALNKLQKESNSEENIDEFEKRLRERVKKENIKLLRKIAKYTETLRSRSQGRFNRGETKIVRKKQGGGRRKTRRKLKNM